MSRTVQTKGHTLNIGADEKELCHILAERIVDMAGASSATDPFTMLLSGGSTPKGLYKKLAELPEGKMPWNRTFLFLGDERCVSHSDGDSNYKMVSDTLLSRISIPSTNVFPTINQDKDPGDSARIYEQTIKRFFRAPADELEILASDEDAIPSWNQPESEEEEDEYPLTFPDFSLALLGLGPDGHTASLFPGTAALDEKERICVANFVPKLEAFRLTLTRPTFAHCQKVFFLVAGAGKKEILKEVLFEPEHEYPSQIVAHDCGNAKVEWYVDEASIEGLV